MATERGRGPRQDGSAGFIEHCPHPILSLARERKIEGGNPAAVRFFGAALRKGADVESLIPESGRPHFRAASTLFASVGGFKGTLQLLRADGEVRVCDVTWSRPPGRAAAVSSMLALDVHDAHQFLLDLSQQVDRFEAAASASNEGWWEWRVAAKEVRFSRRGRAILGIAGDEEVHPLRAWTSRIHPEERLDFGRRLRALAKGKEAVLRHEHRLRHGRTWRFVRVTARPLPARDASPQRVVGTIADFTEERLSREDQLRHRRLFEHSLDGMMIVDAAGRAVEINEAARVLCGLEASQVVLQEAFDDETNRLFEEALRAAAGSLSWNKEVFARPKGGGPPVDLRVAVFPIERDSAGGATMFGVVLHNVTVQKRAQRSDLEHREALARVLRLSTMGEMAGGIAHELNQPLASIVNYLEGCVTRLQHGQMDPASLADVLQRAAHQAHLAGGIIGRMRQFLRKNEPRLAPTSPGALVQETIGFIESTCRRHRVSIDVEVEPKLPPVVVDPIQVEQVLLNLASNAIDAIKRTSPERRRLVFRVNQDPPWVLFRVMDTGGGVPAEWKHAIFDPFFSLKAGQPSLGLGLSISRSLIEGFGGSIWLDEPTEEFTTVFAFRLQAAEVPAAPVSVP